jgi:hypothetical protein
MAMAKEFDELAVDGHNYPTWTSDIKINFASHRILPYLRESTAGVILDEQKKYGALMLSMFCIHKDLKQEYLMEMNPHVLWLSLK